MRYQNSNKQRGENRKSLITKIHIAKAQLGFDNDTYRDFLALHGNGKNSCSVMTVPELYTVYNACVAAGFTPKYKKHGNKDKAKPFASPDKVTIMNKIEALLADAQLPWSYAESIANTMHKKQRLQWCSAQELQHVMIALQKRQRKQRKQTQTHQGG